MLEVFSWSFHFVRMLCYCFPFSLSMSYFVSAVALLLLFGDYHEVIYWGFGYIPLSFKVFCSVKWSICRAMPFSCCFPAHDLYISWIVMLLFCIGISKKGISMSDVVSFKGCNILWEIINGYHVTWCLICLGIIHRQLVCYFSTLALECGDWIFDNCIVHDFLVIEFSCFR